MKNKKRLSGPLAQRIRQHLKLRQSLGFDDYGTRSTLYQFDDYLKKNFSLAQTIDRSMIQGYLKTIENLHPRTRNNHILYLRQFCRFLFQFHSNTYIPEKKLISVGKTSVRPYIYSLDEIKTLMNFAMNLKPRNSLRPHSVKTMLGLLWATGLRIGEVVKLNLQDIDFCEGILHVRKAKFSKERLVPLSLSTLNALCEYLKQRSSFGHSQNVGSPIFINQRQRRYKVQNMDLTFSQLVCKLGLKTQQGGRPRLHDLRHSFATNWLSDIYEKHMDPNALLPVLATYLGHADIAATQAYLHPSQKLLQNIGTQFEQYTKGGCYEKRK